MAIPVYVQAVTTYPGRTQWSDTADYVTGDRVYYADSTSDYSVYVCIQDHSISGGDTPQQPDLTPNYWQAAGSKEYPFLTGSNGKIYPSGFNATEFCVRNSNGFNNNWDPARYLSISDGSERAHVILMDGLFDSGDIGQAFMDLSNTDLYAENFQKSWFIFGYYDNQNTTTENCPTFNNLKIGLHNNNVSFDSHIILNDCLVSDISPYSTRTSFKNTHRFQYGKFIQAKNCLFDFSMCSNNLLNYNPPVSSKFGQSFFKNSTFIFGKQEAPYGGIFYQAFDLIVDKCIFYIKGLVDLAIPKVSTQSMASFTNSCVFAEGPFADVDHFVAGHSSVEDDSNLLNVNPLFVDIENADYRLRPSSPLIRGSKSGSTNEIYVTPAEAAGPVSFDTPADNGSFYTFSSYAGSSFLTGMRTSQNGEIYECLNNDSYDSTKDLSSDTTNWRLVQGTIDDPYKTSDFGDSTINDKLTSDHELILLDGDYHYFPLTSDSSYPTTSPVLRALNRHKAIIYGSVRPAGFITKDLVFQNSLVKNGWRDYPMNGRVGFHLENCVIHSVGEWWPPLNCVVSHCLIFANLDGEGMFYASFGQGESPLPTDKAITFINNTVIFSGFLGSTNNDTVLSSLINQGNVNATFKKNIFCVKSSFDPGPFTNFSYGSFNNSQLISEDNIVFDENGILVDNITKGMTYVDPKLVDTSSDEYGSYRLRPDSPCIGGISNKDFVSDVIWVQQGSGTGTGTEDDPFYWSQYSDAFFAATQTTNKQVVFKDGEYVWTSAVLQDDNVGNSITMIAENMHKALFHDNGNRLSSSGKNPTLRLKGIKLEARDHFTFQPECHYVLDSCHFLIVKYLRSLSIDAKGCIFEVGTGIDMNILSNSGPVDIQNCIFTDHNDRQSAYDYLTKCDSGILKNCIFYSKYPKNTCLSSDSNATLISCAAQNITNPENGVEFTGNLQFIDIENKNYNLRPFSPLIGQGK